MKTIRLDEHRKRLNANPKVFEEHYPKARENFANMFKGYPKSVRLQMADLVFDAQGRKPLFYHKSITTGLPMVWNDPKILNLKEGKHHTWNDCDFFRYEIGHKVPKNSDGKDDPENLCFMSGRCNQHIQSSLSLDEIMDNTFCFNDEIKDRVSALKNLYNSEEWKQLKVKND
jgi:hypothetical protein